LVTSCKEWRKLCTRLFEIKFKLSPLKSFSILFFLRLGLLSCDSPLYSAVFRVFSTGFFPGLPVLNHASPVLYSYLSNVLVYLVFSSYPSSTSWSLFYWSPIHGFSIRVYIYSKFNLNYAYCGVL
jgi:hypothetical protein